MYYTFDDFTSGDFKNLKSLKNYVKNEYGKDIKILKNEYGVRYFILNGKSVDILE